MKIKRKGFAGALGRALGHAFGADTTDQVLQYTIVSGDTTQSISDNTGDSLDDIISLNSWLSNFAVGDSLAPVSNGGAYDGTDYTGQVINYYNPNYVAPTPAAAPAATPAQSTTALPVSTSSLTSLISALTPVASGAAAKAAGVTVTGANAAAQNQMMYTYIGVGLVALVGGYFLIFKEEEKGVRKASNPKRRRRSCRK
jgi:hypothetical protein